MCKFVNNGEHNHIDKCMKPLIKWLNNNGIVTYGSCCGHNKYQMSIVCYNVPNMIYYELLTNTPLARRRRFYKRDSKGFYFIPECVI